MGRESSLLLSGTKAKYYRDLMSMHKRVACEHSFRFLDTCLWYFEVERVLNCLFGVFCALIHQFYAWET